MHKSVRVLIAVLAVSVAAGGALYAKTWKELRKEIKDKYKDFSEEIKTLQIEEKKKIDASSFGASGAKAETRDKIYIKGDKSRIETEIMGRKTALVFNPEKNEKVKQGMEQISANWWSMLDELDGEVEGEEKVEGMDCYKVAIKQKEAQEYLRAIWIDKDSLMLVKGEGQAQGKEFTVVQYDLRKIKKGWIWPYKSKAYVGKDLVSEGTVTSLEVNEDIDDSLFEEDESSSCPAMLGGPMMDEMKKQGMSGQDELDKLKKLKKF